MLILDKARALDLMVSRSERVMVPDVYFAGATARPVASYEPRHAVGVGVEPACPTEASAEERETGALRWAFSRISPS
jgi:hypothetical protein